MATESLANGGSSSTGENLSPAEQLMKKHAADEAHRATIEDVVDEEDVAHPPPSTGITFSETNAGSVVKNAQPLSSNAAGKQKARDEPIGGKESTKPATTTLNTQSDELFPSLGGGPKPRAPAPVAPAWGSRKHAAGSTGAANGVSNGHASPSNVSSRASTPASDMLTPSSMNASTTQANSSRGALPQTMSIPGKYSERIQLAPSQLLPRSQLKKPMPDVLKDISKRSKANVEMRTGPGGVFFFEGKGPVEAVRQALKEVAKQLGSKVGFQLFSESNIKADTKKQSVKVPIPASVRPHVIGRQGAVVQGITQRTGARIQVPKPEDSIIGMDDDDSVTIDVTIEGDAVSAEMARREIEAIVNDRTSTVNMRLKDIPSEFYPFIAGAHNSRVNALEEGRDLRIRIPHYHTWTDQPPPQPTSGNQPPLFAPHAGNPIHISGDRSAAQEARDEIERQVEELRQQITLSQLAINRGQHQFIVGERGDSLSDFLEETGCAVILPPSDDETEMLTITGPADRIDMGINKVMELATSMQMASVDISRQHLNAPKGPQAHARDLTRYFQQRQVVEQLEQLYDAHIVLPTLNDGPVAWEVYSRDGKNTIRARSDIINLINGHPPSRVSQVNIDPFYHEYLRKQTMQRVRDDYGVHVLFPNALEESPEVLLICEGPSTASPEFTFPRKLPSPAEVAEFERTLGEAQDYILSLINGQQGVISKGIEVPQMFHDKVQKFVNREQQNQSLGEIPVRVLVGEPRGQGGRLAPPQNPIAAAALEHEVSLRGPADDVEVMAAKILQYVEEEKENERERGYTTSFEYPQKYANFLIGKKGENIRKYRDEFDVDIQVNDGMVEIKGPKVKAEAAKSRIVALGKKLEDEATHVLKIKPQYHRDLIGSKGGQVNRLQDRYNVRVNFPRSVPNVSTGDDHSVAETASEVGGGQRSNRFQQAQDEVIIKGPKRGADEARDELLSLLQWTIDNSHSATVSVAQSQIPSLIGQGGREMDNMRMTTGAQIDVPGIRDAVDPTGRAEIKLKGTKKQVEDAKKLLQERAKDFDDSVITLLNVDKKYHKALIGSGGANIREMVMKAGGPEDRRELARMVRFPRQDSVDNIIRIEGNKKVVDKITASIEAIVSEREKQVVETVDVAPAKHRLLIGRGGEARRNLESQFSIGIDVPKAGLGRSSVQLTGQPENVEKAKLHIMDIIKTEEGETIQIPRRAHHTISDNGQFFRRLRNDHKVTVDHDGQQPPPRPVSANGRARINSGNLPLITDDQDATDNFSWEIRENNSESGEEGEIPWVLRGNPSNIAKARQVLEKALEQAQQQTSTGYLILPDPRTYRYVIGPGGSQVNSIRKQTGCKITVPRDQAKGEAIEILGGRKGVQEAKDIILEVVKNGGNVGNGSH
ncbi:MAG: hypothetical protein M1827_007705 [Pycnora praestabilis]|nr:MAG: hypothetical protein M1827_007705 [Pycnora praestabilis]